MCCWPADPESRSVVFGHKLASACVSCLERQGAPPPAGDTDHRLTGRSAELAGFDEAPIGSAPASPGSCRSSHSSRRSGSSAASAPEHGRAQPAADPRDFVLAVRTQHEACANGERTACPYPHRWANHRTGSGRSSCSPPAPCSVLSRARWLSARSTAPSARRSWPARDRDPPGQTPPANSALGGCSRENSHGPSTVLIQLTLVRLKRRHDSYCRNSRSGPSSRRRGRNPPIGTIALTTRLRPRGGTYAGLSRAY
jgi:hypothetical protein